MSGISATVYNPFSMERYHRQFPLLDHAFDYHDDMRSLPARESFYQRSATSRHQGFDLY